VDPVPDPLLLRKSGSAGDRTRDLCICSQKLWPLATNLGKRRLTRHRSALPANPTSSRPRSWSLGNATLIVAERSGRRRVLSASKPRPSAKGAHPYRKRACLEALRLATTKLTQWETGYPSWGTLPNTESSEDSCNSGDETFMMMIMTMRFSKTLINGIKE